jgi:hypothetical protein
MVATVISRGLVAMILSFLCRWSVSSEILVSEEGNGEREK